jgi:hypothetical protein
VNGDFAGDHGALGFFDTRNCRRRADYHRMAPARPPAQLVTRHVLRAVFHSTKTGDPNMLLHRRRRRQLRPPCPADVPSGKVGLLLDTVLRKSLVATMTEDLVVRRSDKATTTILHHKIDVTNDTAHVASSTTHADNSHRGKKTNRFVAELI